MPILSENLRKVVLTILSDLDTPLASTVSKLIGEAAWADLARLRVSPSDYTSADLYHRDAIAVSLIRKLKLPTGIDTAAVAFEKWQLAERQCKLTNDRLRSLSYRENYPLEEDLQDPYFQAQLTFVRCVRKWVSRLVGRVPSISGRPSKRSTYRLKGRESVVVHKFSTIPERTSRCDYIKSGFHATAWYRFLTGTSPMSVSPIIFQEDDIVRGNRFSTVPKDGTTDRPIACEPTLNVFAQLGVGDGLKLRLRKWGLLATQSTCGFESQAWHKELARRASIDGTLATVDLSSASDTVSKQLVVLLFPPDWCDLFLSFRSPITEVDKRAYVLEKISSMGNGFTFELETTVFAACAAAAMELSGVKPSFPSNVSVYGDDIILPRECYHLLQLGLTFLGFTINETKSFSDGPFRESCGGDFFLGRDVRPIFIESDPSGPLEWISLHNKVFRLRHLVPVGKALHLIRQQLPSKLRWIYGPEQLGDAVLHTDDDSLYDCKIMISEKKNHPSGYRVQHAVLPVHPSVSRSRWDCETEAVACLYGCTESVPLPGKGGGSMIPIIGYRVDWVAWG